MNGHEHETLKKTSLGRPRSKVIFMLLLALLLSVSFVYFGTLVAIERTKDRMSLCSESQGFLHKQHQPAFNNQYKGIQQLVRPFQKEKSEFLSKEGDRLQKTRDMVSQFQKNPGLFNDEAKIQEASSHMLLALVESKPIFLKGLYLANLQDANMAYMGSGVDSKVWNLFQKNLDSALSEHRNKWVSDLNLILAELQEPNTFGLQEGWLDGVQDFFITIGVASVDQKSNFGNAINRCISVIEESRSIIQSTPSFQGSLP